MLEEYKVVVISTSHLEQRTAEALVANGGGKGDPDFLGFSAAVYEDGFFVTCHSAEHPEPADEPHPSLWLVRWWARSKGYMVVQFDSDADATPELPTYEW